MQLSLLHHRLCALALMVLTTVSCQKENTDSGPDNYLESGSALVTNEGNFMSNNSSVSYIDRNGVVFNTIFERANAGANLGDVLQSYTRVGNKGILCINNSRKLEIVDARTFKRIATIADPIKTSYPRYALAINDQKAYVSNGNFEGSVQVLDLATSSITKSIPVGKGPEQMVLHGNTVYVCNSGGFDVDSTISLINTSTETVTSTLTVGDIPIRIVKDAQNYLWVLCSGQSDYSAWPDITKLSASRLVRINTETNTIERSFTLINTGSPSYVVHLAIGDNGRKIYYSVSDRVYSMDITATTLPSAPLISGRSFYGLAASPYTNQIWGMYAPSFSASGYVFRYTSTGDLIDSLKVGIGPNGVAFN